MLLNKYSDRYYQVILFLAIFQSFGIRLFQGVGITLSIVLFVLLLQVSKISAKAIFLIFICFLFLMLKSTPIAYAINVCAIILNSTLLIQVYQNRSFINDLYYVLNFFYVQGFVTFVLTIIIPESFWVQMTSGVSIPTLSLGYLFYCPSNAPLVGPIKRLMGLAWEPGCFQMLLNIFLFIGINRGEKLKRLASISFLIVMTGSTVGYILFMLNMLYYFKRNNLKTLVKTMWVVLPVFILVFPFLHDNIVAKMMESDSGTINSSGIIRYRDFLTGLYSLFEHPILGLDISDLASNPEYQRLEYKAISAIIDPRGWYNYLDYACGGFTNGYFYTTLLWGGFGIILLYWFVTNRLWRLSFGKDWYFIPLIIALSMTSEPISNTILFYFLALFNLFSFKYQNNENINSNSHI